EGQPPSPTKSKEEQPEDLQDDAEGRWSNSFGSSVFCLMNNFSFITFVLIDETKPSAVASLSSEDTELSENKDPLKDSKGTQGSDSVDPVVCEQDQAKGKSFVS
ncbi:hypothetical protein N302_14340, partial [Corvus brachyrhynchos]